MGNHSRWLLYVAVSMAVLLIAVLAPVGSWSSAPRAPFLNADKALAGDFGSGGAGDRQLLGLFSESLVDYFKPKVARSEWGQVRNVRLYAQWKRIEGAGKGKFNWSKLDSEVNAALSMGVNGILLNLTVPSPAWALNKATPKPRDMGPPKRMKDWADFCGAVAKRYKGIVDYYEIWNEPGWDSGSQAGLAGVVYYSGDCEYTYLGVLRASYKAIKGNDPDAYIIGGSLLKGLTRGGDNFRAYDTLMAGANQDVSLQVDATNNIVAERPMYFNYHGTMKGGNVELGSRVPGTTWYLAEGATHPGFEEWICIQNPGKVNATVNITYMFPGGETKGQQLIVGPNTRSTVSVNDAVGPYRDVSTRIDSTVPVCVERPMYFNYHGVLDGGSIGSGVASLSKTWYLAEGATQPGFEQWISLMNPGSSPTNVTITYMFPGGETMKQDVHMAQTSRETVNVNEFVGPNKDVSAKVEATNPIIAERPMYFLYHGAWKGGGSQFGATSANTSWFLSEGTTRNNEVDGAFEQWISIQNPGDKPTDVTLKYMFGDGTTQDQVQPVPAHARETIMVNDVVGPNKDVSVKIDSKHPVVVERPMYFAYHNWCDGGDVELGCTTTSSRWYFAEGTTRGGFEEWLTLQNPNGEKVTAKITGMFSDGTTQEKWVDLPPHSRSTVSINEMCSMGNLVDAFSIHPYDYPEWWSWYTKAAMDVCAKYPSGRKEMTVTEIGWPHAGRAEFSYEGQRQAIGAKGIGSLWSVGVRKIWIFQDIDPVKSWDDAFNGMFLNNGKPTPAWNEYKNWQNVLPNYGNKPGSL